MGVQVALVAIQSLDALAKSLPEIFLRHKTFSEGSGCGATRNAEQAVSHIQRSMGGVAGISAFAPPPQLALHFFTGSAPVEFPARVSVPGPKAMLDGLR